LRIVPVTILAGAAGAGGCPCCAMADGLTRTLRELHHAHVASGGLRAIVVDATGGDPRPAIGALARIPLASLRLALSGVVALGEDDPLALALADAVIDPANATVAQAIGIGLYRDGVLDARSWLDRPAGARLAWSRPEPCRWEDVESALQALQLQLGERLFRFKGLVGVPGEPGPRVVQAFGHTRYPSARLPCWPDASRASRATISAPPLEAAAIGRILGSIPIPPP
jgi:G3E family GTPase